ILDIFEIDNKTFSKCCKIYIEDYNPSVDKTTTISTDFIEMFSVKLGLSFNIKKLCLKILQAANDLVLLNKYSPQTVAAGVIYFVNVETGLNLDKETIVNYCDTKFDTISIIVKILRAKKIEIFNIVKYGHQLA